MEVGTACGMPLAKKGFGTPLPAIPLYGSTRNNHVARNIDSNCIWDEIYTNLFFMHLLSDDFTSIYLKYIKNKRNALNYFKEDLKTLTRLTESGTYNTKWLSSKTVKKEEKITMKLAMSY